MPFELNWNAYKENFFIVGENQTGKTNLAKVMTKLLELNGFNVLVRDPHRRWTNIDPMAVKTSLGELTGNGLEIYQPVTESEKDFDDVTYWAGTKYNLVYIMDELHNYCKKQSAPKSLDYFCRNCNNRSMGYGAIFQRPAEIPNYVLSNATHRFMFRLDLPSDIKFMKKFIGQEAERFEIDSINPMQEFHGLYKINKGGKRAEEFYVNKFD